jgi:RND family efflux transporter MFP subunit
MLYIHLLGRQARIIGAHLRTVAVIIWSFIKSHRLLSGAVFVLVIAGGVGLSYLFPTQTTSEISTSRTVTVVRAGDAAESVPLSVIGTVRSTREALVAPDTSGMVSAIYRSLGDYVGAGTVIAELKNDSQRAGVAQARAALQKTQSGFTIGGIGVTNAESSYQSAQESARTTLLSTYASMSDVVERRIDQTFTNPTGAQPRFIVSTSNSQLVANAEAGRLAMQPILTREAMVTVSGMNTDALIAELERTQNEVKAAQGFAQDVVQALNGALTSASVTESEISLYRLEASAALATVNALSASIAGSIENLKARRAAVTIAETSLSTGTTGESADIASANANLAAALANLERTLIRAPIAGTINRLDLDVGSFVNASQPVIYITSAGGLEAVAYVSGTDLVDIRPGAKVTVAGSVEGTVVRTAAALDPVTKKAEIRVALPASSALISGQSATLEIIRAKSQALAAQNTVTVPLAALKITPEGPLLFTVSDDSTLVANPVSVGTIRGGFIDITSGISPDAAIVSDARGLKEGQVVLVKL